MWGLFTKPGNNDDVYACSERNRHVIDTSKSHHNTCLYSYGIRSVQPKLAMSPQLAENVQVSSDWQVQCVLAIDPQKESFLWRLLSSLQVGKVAGRWWWWTRSLCHGSLSDLRLHVWYSATGSYIACIIFSLGVRSSVINGEIFGHHNQLRSSKYLEVQPAVTCWNPPVFIY